MKVTALTEGTRTVPASRIRVYEILDRLRDEDLLSYRAVSYTSEGYCRALVGGEKIGMLRVLLEQLWHLWSILWFMTGLAGADVVLIQRTLLPVWLQKLICKINPHVVYDFDDAVYLHSASHDARFSHQMRISRTVVAVSGLAVDGAVTRGAARDKVATIYTPVDCSRFEPRGSIDTDSFTVGWIGSPATSRYLNDIWPELARFAASEPRVEFVFIGCPEFDTGDLESRVKFVPWSPETEQRELPLLDVGLMPLEDTAWERGKGGYKLIQYMAAGVATVSSPVGANVEIVHEGVTGLFANGKGDWSGKLGELLAGRERCALMGRAGRKRAEEMFDYRVESRLFSSVLDRAKSHD